MIAPIESRSANQSLDYFIQTWIRIKSDYNQNDPSRNESLFQFGNSLRCDFFFNNTLICQSFMLVNGSSINFANLNNQRRTSIRLSLADIEANTWISLSLGGSVNIGTTNSTRRGFYGDIRELKVLNTFITLGNVTRLMNQYLTWDFLIMAHYRLQKGNLFDDFRNYMRIIPISQNSSNLLIWNYDQISNDICYSFFSQSQLLRINTTQLKPVNTTIDPRMSISLYSYIYSVSIWLRPIAGIVPNQTYNQSQALFTLNGSFSIWFSDVNQIKVIIFATTATSNRITNAIFVPMNQWSNLQFIIDRSTNTFEAKVYDLQRRLLTDVKQSLGLSNQSPNRVFTLFNNYQGYVKSIMVYQSRKTFPMVSSIGASTQISDSTLIIFYKFDRQNFNDSQLLPLNTNNLNMTGSTIQFNSTLQFDNVFWEENLNYTNSSTLGTVNQTLNFFDGIACNDSSLHYNFQNKTSYVSYDLSYIPNDTYQATLELWFMKSIQMTEKNYLVSIYSDLLKQEYFSIYQNDGKLELSCKPGGDSNIEFTYQGYMPIVSAWQHIACKFQSHQEISGLYYNQAKDQFLDSISAFNKLMMIPKGPLRLIIGNNYEVSRGQNNTLIKEVRLWGIQRRDYDIIQSRFRQLSKNQQSGLIAYFRMNSEDLNIFNYLNITQSIETKSSGLQLINSDQSILICPLNMYPDSFTKKCQKNPYIEQNIIVLPQFGNNKSIDVLLTSNISDIYAPIQNDGLSYRWSYQNISNMSQTIINPVTQFETLTIINISSLNNTQNISYTQKIMGQSNAFLQNSNITLQLNNCSIAVDNQTNQTMTRLNYYNVSPGQQDINFTIKDMNISGPCNSSTRNMSLHKYLTFNVVPFTTFIDLYVYDVNDTLGQYFVTIQKDQQINMMNDSQIFLQIRVYWNVTEQLTNGSLTYYSVFHDLVYIINFISPIIPKIAVFPLQGVLQGENITFDPTNSYFIKRTSQIDKTSLSYQWTCPSVFSQACSSIKNLKYLTISYYDFVQAQAQLNANYIFTLTTWKSTEYDSSYNYSIALLATWQQYRRPYFTLDLSNKGNLLASQNNTLQLNLLNYDFNSKITNISWQIDSKINTTYLQISRNSTLLVIGNGGLNYSTEYSFNVTIFNKDYLDANNSKQFVFKTGYPPFNGSALIQPLEGFAFQTNFTLSIANWTSNNSPIRYKVYGIFNKSNQIYPITTDYILSTQNFTTHLPGIQQLLFDITDSSNEIQTVILNVTVKNQTNQTTQEALFYYQQLSLDEMLHNYKLICYQLLQNDSMQMIQILDGQTIMLNSLDSITSFYSTNNDDMTDESIRNVSMMMNILNMISNIAYPTNDTHILKSLKVLKQLKQKSQAFDYLLQTQQSFLQDYLASISNMIIYSESRSFDFQTSQMLRMLMQNYRFLQTNATTYFLTLTQLRNYMKDIILQQKQFGYQYCQVLTSDNYHIQKYFQSNSFQYVIEMVPSNQFMINRTYVNLKQDTYVSLPIKNMIDNGEIFSQNKLEDLCVQVSFGYYNPLIGYKFINQTISIENSIVEISTIDNLGTKYLDSVGIKGDITNGTNRNSIFNITFAFQFEEERFNFKNNQTVCMHMRNDQQDYSQMIWGWDQCETVYLKLDNQILCKCSNLGQQYYAIGNDYSRFLILPPQSLIEKLYSILMQFDNSVVAIVFTILFLIVLMPLIAICFDKCDYDSLKNTKYTISEDFLRKIAAKKELPYDSVIYNTPRYDSYLKIEQLDCWQLYKIFVCEIHPLFSIFYQFDFELKRLIRLMFLTYQVCTVAIICGLAFGTTYRVDEQDDYHRTQGSDSTDNSNGIICGFILGILLFPSIGCIVDSFKTRLIFDNQGQKVEGELQTDNDITRNRNKSRQGSQTHLKTKKKSDEEDFENIKDVEDERNIHTVEKLRYKDDRSQNHDKSYMYKEDNTSIHLNVSRIDDKVIPYEKCIVCKVIMLFLCFIYAILAMLTVSLESGANPKAHSISMVIAFWVAIIISFLVYNMIYLMFTAKIAPGYVKSELDYDGDVPMYYRCLGFLFIPEDAKIIMRDMFLIYELNSIEQQQNQLQQQDKQQRASSIHQPQARSNMAAKKGVGIQQRSAILQTPEKDESKSKYMKQQRFAQGPMDISQKQSSDRDNMNVSDESTQKKEELKGVKGKAQKSIGRYVEDSSFDISKSDDI